MKKYSDDEILNHLKDYYKRNNKISQYGFSKDKTVCNPSIVKVRFGSWENALKKAGIDYEVEDLSIEGRKAKIKKQLKDYILKTGKLPSTLAYKSENNLPSIITLNKYFGSKENLYVELGYTGKKFGSLLNKKEIIKAIKNFYIREGRVPKQEDFYVKNGLPTRKNVKKYFSGFSEAKIAAGFKIAYQYRIYTEEESIKAIQKFYKREERYPLKVDFKAENNLPTIRKIKGIFGTVRAAREAAGLTKAVGKHKTFIIKEELEEILVQKYKEKGRRLTSLEIKADKELPTLGTIYSTLRRQSLKEAWEYIEKKHKLKKK